MNKTAVEWLEQQLFYKRGKFTKGDIDQAKEMEKWQIIEAVYYCLESVKISDDKTMFTATTAEQYYHETFKG